MTRLVVLGWVLFASLLVFPCSFLIPSEAAQDKQGGQKKKVLIEGTVFDHKKRGINGVDVTVWVTGRADRIVGKTTENDGSYKFEFEVSEPFNVAYTSTKYRLMVISNLAEQANQKVSLVLYPKG